MTRPPPCWGTRSPGRWTSCGGRGLSCPPAYALLRGIDYIYEECPFAVDATSLRYKELLNALERDSPGSKLRFYLNFLKAREQHPGFLPEDGTPALRACPTCGQATTNDGECTFCRMWDRVRSQKTQEANISPA